MSGRDLYAAPEGGLYRVVRVPDVKILRSLGIFPGAVVLKKKRCKFGGPALIRLATREIALGKDVAQAIWVKEEAT
jgi:Fe2+ transport system protein FeoA